MRNEAETRQFLIDTVLSARGWDGLIKKEETLGEVKFEEGKRHATRHPGRTDYTLRFPTSRGQDLVAAILEAKAESAMPGTGLEQVKRYADRLKARFVYSTNGHQFVEYDTVTGYTSEPKPISQFPTPDYVAEKWEQQEGIDVDSEDAKPLTSPYTYGEHERRGYQDGAIRAALMQIARGEKRVLLHLATGTGKTFIAANLFKKIAAGEKLGRGLFLCDRDELRTNALRHLQNYFGGEAAAATTSDSAKNARVIVATYQTLGFSDQDDEDQTGSYLTRHYPEDFFTHIIIDEAHRSGFGRWRQVLERNSNAIQIGLTATPREIENFENLSPDDERRFQDTINYFGQPAYSYPLADALEDGFLAKPLIDRYRIHINRSVDGEENLLIRVSESDQLEIVDARTGDSIRELPQDYRAHELETKLQSPERVHAMCAHLFKRVLQEEGTPESKTLVFCAGDSHAQRVAAELNNLYAAYCAERRQPRNDPYAVQITSEAGTKALPDFRGAATHTFVATTVDLLSTGVDLPGLKNVVFFRYINSPILVSQMIGRGTRIDPKTNKLFFRVFDYTDATRLLGERFLSTAVSLDRDDLPKEVEIVEEPTAGPVRVHGLLVEISDAGRFVTDREGRRLALEEALYDLHQALRREASSVEELRERWVPPRERRELMTALGSAATVAPTLRHMKEMEDFDLWDFFGETGFEAAPLRRVERADQLLHSKWISDLDERARGVTTALMGVFETAGTEGLEGRELFVVPAVARAGGLAALGGADRFLEMRGVLFS